MQGSRVAALLSHFGVSRPADVTWAHGVNSRRALERALREDTAMLIEGDISWLPHDGGVRMAHPPTETSDLGFDAWIEAIAAAGRGAKLDFKDPEVVPRCLERLKELRANGGLEIPILLNADVLPGPGGRPPRFEGARLLAAFSRDCGDVIPSLGFTTGRHDAGCYVQAMVEPMLQLCAAWPGEVTIPIRACYLAESGDAVERLLARDAATLTLWNARNDPPVTARSLLRQVDADRTFVDLIDREGLPLRQA